MFSLTVECNSYSLPRALTRPRQQIVGVERTWVYASKLAPPRTFHSTPAFGSRMMSTAEDTMIDYYAQRALEYERVYAKPERQTDLQSLGQFLSGAFTGDTVLEVACGTGYWTHFIAQSAAAILATDFNSEVIDVARRKDFGGCPVQFTEADAYVLDDVPNQHSSGFHGFWWSHVPVAKIDSFLTVFHSKLSCGAKVVMIDNAYVEDSSTPISRRDSEGNTYQIRRLENESEHEVLKNFPSEAQMRESLSGHATDISVRFLHYFWITEYRTRKNAEQDKCRILSRSRAKS